MLVSYAKGKENGLSANLVIYKLWHDSFSSKRMQK